MHSMYNLQIHNTLLMSHIYVWHGTPPLAIRKYCVHKINLL